MTNQPKLTTVANTEPATRGALYRIKTSKQSISVLVENEWSSYLLLSKKKLKYDMRAFLYRKNVFFFFYFCDVLSAGPYVVE